MVRRRGNRTQISLKDDEALVSMRVAGKIVALALEKVGLAIRPGITTGEIDQVAESTIRGLGAIPAFLGYNGYPATACVSVNDEVVHGIPGSRVLLDGDVVGIDLGAIIAGWHADAAFTFPVGAISAAAARLLTAGQEALTRGIAAAVSGNKIRDIGQAIASYTMAEGYSVVRDLCGHGIGRKLHEPPQVPNYPTFGEGDRILQSGMTLAIEPMINAGSADVRLLEDGWTYVTEDGALSVHFEHTIVIGPTGPEILTTRR
jgi:methionyl aminopeptidase